MHRGFHAGRDRFLLRCHIQQRSHYIQRDAAIASTNRGVDERARRDDIAERKPRGQRG
jgi:hypothetical protein